MKRFHIDCELGYDIIQQSLFVFNLAIPSTAAQRVVAETVATAPATVTDEFRDEGGHNRYIRADVGPGPFSIRYQATVDIEPPEIHEQAPETPLAKLPGEILTYVKPSRYCEVDAIYSFAFRKFGKVPPGYQRVRAICEWVKGNVDYQLGSSTVNSSARDVLANRAGVCRDFAHLVIALCRALNIPARFVTAYTRYDTPPQDFHAVIEAYLGDRWYLFDPTGLASVANLVRLGTGRDALDVPFATFFGSTRLRRLSPLVQPARAGETLVGLQTPNAGILLSPGDVRSGYGS
jgi:transglutaminase-like putative cysteine protease